MIETIINHPDFAEALAFIGRWGLTYLVHSTLLIAGVWLFDRLRPRLRDETRELLWRGALAGGFVTSMIVMALPHVTIAPTVRLDPLVKIVDAGSHAILPDASSFVAPVGVVSATPSEMPVMGASAARDRERGLPLEAERQRWVGTGQAALLLGSVLGVALLFSAWRRTCRLGDHRVEVTHGLLRSMFDELLATASLPRRIRLTCSDRLISPAAFGVLRPEICVPVRALTTLSSAEQRAMLAHELAHHARRDPWWMLGSTAAMRLCFVQPLLRLVHQRLRDLAELRADALALRWTRDELALASCLVTVGEWVRDKRGRAMPELVGAMAREDSPLERRVQRMLTAPQPASPPVRSPRRALAVMALVLTAIAALTPRVGAGGEVVIENVAAPLNTGAPSSVAVMPSIGSEIDHALDELSRELAALRLIPADSLPRGAMLDSRLAEMTQRHAALVQRWMTLRVEMMRLHEEHHIPSPPRGAVAEGGMAAPVPARPRLRSD